MSTTDNLTEAQKQAVKELFGMFEAALLGKKVSSVSPNLLRLLEVCLIKEERDLLPDAEIIT